MKTKTKGMYEITRQGLAWYAYTNEDGIEVVIVMPIEGESWNDAAKRVLEAFRPAWEALGGQGDER